MKLSIALTWNFTSLRILVEDFWLTSPENQESRMFPRKKNEQNIQKYTDSVIYKLQQRRPCIIYRIYWELKLTYKK